MTKYYIETRWGGSEDEPNQEFMMKAIRELDVKDQEHPDTWLEHESGWMITLHEKGVIVFENTAGKSVRHMQSQDKDMKLKLWTLLSEGKIDDLNKMNWLDGRGVPPQSVEERKEVIDAVNKMDLDWYNKLSPADETRKCSKPNCTGYAIRNSVMCKMHHFEMIRKKPCPFSH
jgi:hypothetical protein